MMTLDLERIRALVAVMRDRQQTRARRDDAAFLIADAVPALIDEIERLLGILTSVDDYMGTYDWQEWPTEIEAAVKHAIGRETYDEFLERSRQSAPPRLADESENE